MIKNPDTDRRCGIMFGLAYGDALGRPFEFASAKSIDKLGTPFRKQVGLNDRIRGKVTDDTQMSIAVARAIRGHGRPNPAHLTTQFVREFIRWDLDPKSHTMGRSPGGTCLSATHALRAGKHWQLATRIDSKGNGANMRTAPIALRTDWTWDEMAAVSQLQAAITHGHATALAATNLTTAAIRMLLEGVARPNEQFIDHLMAYAWDQRENYHLDYLGHLWQTKAHEKPRPRYGSYQGSLPGLDDPGHLAWWDDAAGRTTPKRRPARLAVESPEEFIRRGWDKMISVLEAIRLVPRDKQQDPCDIGGSGWVAEEALATSLHTLLCFPDDPTNALRRAAFTEGDSDSIASITGALAGAAYGLKAFPSHWIPNVEYGKELTDLTAALTQAARKN